MDRLLTLRIETHDVPHDVQNISGLTDLTWKTDSPLDTPVSNCIRPDNALNSDIDLESGHAGESLDQKEPDDSFASVDQSDSGECQNSFGPEGDNTDDSINMDSDDNQCGPLNGSFLEVNAMIKLLQQSEKCLEKIPSGLKENVYFVVKNENNFDRRKNGQNSRFSDDCGVWQSDRGGSPISYFLILPSGELKGVVKRKNEGYCFKRKSKGQYYYVKLNPQPLDSELIELHRYYAKLKKDLTYEKRVSWLGLGGDIEIAVVEYIGKYPCVAPHGNSKNFHTYSNFFFNLRIKLNGVDTSNLVVGTDDERALVNAIKAAFPQSRHILCTRHLRQNANQKLTHDAVDKYDKGKILDKIFGDDGLLHADDRICFEEQCEELESISQSISKNFLKYFQKRLKDLLREKRNDPDAATQTDKLWTNNNCESINHVLKQAIDWKRQPLLDFITFVNELVDGQFKDPKRAMVSIGRFRLAETHRQFVVSKAVWANKTDDERHRLFRRFRKHEIKNPLKG